MPDLDVDLIEASIIEEMDKNKVAGFTIAIVKDNEIMYKKGFGVTSTEESGTPVVPETIFRIGSIGKLFTATMIMKLFDKGVLDLDRPIKQYVPWFNLTNEKAAEELTIRMLLSHRSGITNGGDYYWKRDSTALQEYVKNEISKKKVYAPPGRLFMYSNHNFNIAGCVAEVVTGIHFETLLQELVFDPLKMPRTTYNPSKAMTYSFALPHTVQQDGSLSVHHHIADNVACYPSMHAMSNVIDLANFAILYLNKGKFQSDIVISHNSIEEMFTGQTKLYSTDLSGELGLSFFLHKHNGIQMAGHFGSHSTYTSELFLAPHEGVAVITLSSCPFPHYEAVIKKILDTYFPPKNKHQEWPKPFKIDHKNVEDYLGCYLGPNVGLVEVIFEQENIHITLHRQKRRLEPSTREGIFVMKDDFGNEVGTVSFEKYIEEEIITYLMVNSSLCERIECSQLETQNMDLDEYVGSFRHFSELVYEIFHDNGKLKIRELGKESSEELIPIKSNLFVGSKGTMINLVEFLRSENGRIDEFILNDGWIMRRDNEKSIKKMFVSI